MTPDEIIQNPDAWWQLTQSQREELASRCTLVQRVQLRRKLNNDWGIGPEVSEDAGFRFIQAMSARDLQILVRFYLDGQSPEQICRESELTETQFKAIKARAKDLIRQCMPAPTANA